MAFKTLVDEEPPLSEDVSEAVRDASPARPQVDFVGNSPAIREILSIITVVADSTTPVMITGESGTGKDVVARLIHLNSPRAHLPFIAINCAAVPKEVFENELFGHERGAFTGAIARKAGYLEMAHRGTLFLDELGEMDSDTQAKLLRVIESRALRRLGGKDEIHVDVRMLAATNKNMQQALQNGEMRRDLYYRFSVIEIFLPPLRDRKEDIPVLVEHFLATICQKHGRPAKAFSNDAMKMLLQYDWPGNIRELRNVIERAVILCGSERIVSDFLPQQIVDSRSDGHQITLPIGTPLRAAEKSFILKTLSAVGNNKSRAAQILGLSRKALYNKLKRYNAS